MYKSYTYSVKFIPKCFILFIAIINEIVFLVSLLDCSVGSICKYDDFLYIDLLPHYLIELIY